MNDPGGLLIGQVSLKLLAAKSPESVDNRRLVPTNNLGWH
jgi:hypothetical protein